ncbi:MAG TPA: carbohydrate ABC transporter permease [candidate division WOR-3 bacterium]|uniref:Carbohydrate ABC transporter permease n=1 Tax=candidate division WOR-3 bacterium TaxID=2052148 RepID=A0A7C1BCN8_UNCW3|nr:MAG: carbohydrate ABC transporter permease [Candidatus Hydrothermae bacterium]HDM90790.1 carbohydrate ABC transporter permease [candidate division WOR-3 bacterium]
MSEEKTKKILISASSVFILLFSLVPLLWMLAVSFSGNIDFLRSGRYLITLSNYHDIVRLRNLHFTDYMRNSMIIATLTSLIVVAIGLFAAYAVTRMNFPRKELFVMGVLAVSMFPQISIVGYLFKLMSSIGLINTYPALIIPYVAWTTPVVLWLLTSYLTGIPRELDEAALVDGASRGKALLRVIFPVAAPGVFSAILIAFILSYNEFMFALMLTNDFRARTIPVGIALFQGLHGEIPWGYVMAGAALASLPVILIALFFQRYITEGLTRGAVKG